MAISAKGKLITVVDQHKLSKYPKIFYLCEKIIYKISN